MKKEDKYLEINTIKDLLEELQVPNVFNLYNDLINKGYNGINISPCQNSISYSNVQLVGLKPILENKDIIKYFKKPIYFNEYSTVNNKNGTQFFKNSLIFNNCKFQGGITFKRYTFEKNLKFNDCIFEGKIRIIDSEIKGKLLLDTIKDLDFLQIGGTNGDININEIIFNKVYVTEEKGLFLLHNIKNCKFTYKYSSVIPRNIKLTNNKFTELNFIDIDLGKTTFNGIKIKKLYLENATLNDCIFNGVEFGNDYRLKNIKDEKGNIDYFKMKDNYRQLKFVMDKNGNITEGNKFFGKEMEFHFYEISWWNPKKYLLLIQLIISYFGNIWLLPIIYIILFGLISTQLYGHYFIIDFGYNFPYIDINLGYYNKDFLKEFLLNINPFDKKLFNIELVTWNNFIHKIILIVLYWHLIVALKRTTKR